MHPCYEPSADVGSRWSRSERTVVVPRMETMSFPDLEYRTTPVRESDADLLLLALPPLDAEGSPDLSDWPGLREALSGVGFTGAAGAWVRAYAPDATTLPLAVVGTGSAPDAAALRDAVGGAI